MNIPKEIFTALNGNQNKLAIINQLLEKRGTFIKLHVRRPLNLLTKYRKLNVIGWKDSVIQVRCGVEYNSLTKIIEEKGKNNKSEPLSGRTWIYYPYVLKSNSNSKILFRFYTINNNYKPKTKYIINGYEVQKEDLAEFCQKSEYEDKPEKPCFDLSIDSIESIN